MQAVLLHCKPRARFHFGKPAPDSNTSLNTAGEWLPSDTLFSALINILAEIYPDEVERLLGHFLSGDVVISSAFYALDTGEKTVFFLPKPAHYGLQVSEEFKRFNRVKLISQTVWEQGWLFDEWTSQCVFLQNGTVVAAKSDLPKTFFEGKTDDEQKAILTRIALYRDADFPHVKNHTQDRLNRFYYVTTTSIADNRAFMPGSSVHMYFLFDTVPGFEREPDFAKIRTAIQLLPDRGVGGERSGGCGFFEKAEFRTFHPPSTGSGHYCMVSLTIPGNPAEFERLERYQVQTRGGRQYGSAEKRFDFIRMLSEGAYANGKVQGQIVKIGMNEGHTVWRYGKAFCLETHAAIQLETQ